MERDSIKINFLNKQGHLLSAVLEKPTIEPIAYGIFAHCFTCTKDYVAPSRICKKMAENGIAMLRFDFTGLGESEGEFETSTFSTNKSDLLSAVEMLEQDYQAPQLLIGHSLGGTTSLAASINIPSLKAIATIGSARDPRHIMKYFEQNNQINLIDNEYAEITISGRAIRMHKRFLDDLSKHDVKQDTIDFNGTVFTFHAPNDELTSFDNAEIIQERASHPKHLVKLSDTANHMLTSRNDTDFIANTLSDWIKNDT